MSEDSSHRPVHSRYVWEGAGRRLGVGGDGVTIGGSIWEDDGVVSSSEVSASPRLSTPHPCRLRSPHYKDYKYLNPHYSSDSSFLVVMTSQRFRVPLLGRRFPSRRSYGTLAVGDVTKDGDLAVPPVSYPPFRTP